ncbi:hypothetical protein MGYG_06472 [Nannizzia gypsea CBS 118893]|uniref:Uncharacterized protein n=1 Tax=Arthroderma gypseum (strain ATCC MYA-4604 / CBS 118893) TaxID=535722 RepID=E4UZE4_ARTGP|nr:hypothetical protein MGYG_06472 [Nannizzia gypsea CBS 118893]EFR03474.1 hypothetical protein MGYG_06472 [Nannizzia gypsea CBS 118893]
MRTQDTRSGQTVRKLSSKCRQQSRSRHFLCVACVDLFFCPVKKTGTPWQKKEKKKEKVFFLVIAWSLDNLHMTGHVKVNYDKIRSTDGKQAGSGVRGGMHTLSIRAYNTSIKNWEVTPACEMEDIYMDMTSLPSHTIYRQERKTWTGWKANHDSFS